MATKKSATKKAAKKAPAKRTHKAKAKPEAPPINFDALTDKEHSIPPELAEQIAEERKTHEDERPPNAKLDVPEIIAQAWLDVKGATDPPLGLCVPSHVDRYFFHGQKILQGNAPMAGETILARFERRVSELMRG